MNNSSKINALGLVFFVSIIFSYIISEDTLGGAKHDYLFHERLIISFANDFFYTFNNYGDGDLFTRNSPIFYIALSFLFKLGIELESIRYLNLVAAPLIIYSFYQCLKIRFSDINDTYLKFFSFIIFLSPTVRSLIIWPYPILYAFILFLVSIKFYLKFLKDDNHKLSNALKSTLFVALSAYITPNFSVFAIFLIYKFYLEFKLSKNLNYIIILNFFLALPAVIYYYIFDFYFFKHTVYEVSNLIKFNVFNKIVIITSLLFFYFLPFLKKDNFRKLIYELLDIKKNYIIYFFVLICVYSFNYPPGFGGGIFYHISSYLFSSNYFLFLIFFLSIFLFKSAKLININNILIFICLILYNLQISIYHKYFDPLIMFVYLFLFSFEKFNLKTNIKGLIKKYYCLYLIFLGISVYKVGFLA